MSEAKTYEVTESQLRSAIEQWLRLNHEGDAGSDYEITWRLRPSIAFQLAASAEAGLPVITYEMRAKQ